MDGLDELRASLASTVDQLAADWAERCRAELDSDLDADAALPVVAAVAHRVGSGDVRAALASLPDDRGGAITMADLAILRELLLALVVGGVAPGSTIDGIRVVDRALDEVIAELQRRRLEGLNTVALVDALTGMGNRRALEQQLAQQVSLANRHDRPLSVVMIDVDGLKHVNDTLGHLAGDELLRTLANQLRTVLRAEDLLFRIGGDEFVVVLPDTPPELLGDLLGRAARQAPAFSYGISSLPTDGDDAGSLLARADERLLLGRRVRGHASRQHPLPVPAHAHRGAFAAGLALPALAAVGVAEGVRRALRLDLHGGLAVAWGASLAAASGVVLHERVSARPFLVPLRSAASGFLGTIALLAVAVGVLTPIDRWTTPRDAEPIASEERAPTPALGSPPVGLPPVADEPEAPAAPTLEPGTEVASLVLSRPANTVADGPVLPPFPLPLLDAPAAAPIPEEVGDGTPGDTTDDEDDEDDDAKPKSRRPRNERGRGGGGPRGPRSGDRPMS